MLHEDDALEPTVSTLSKPLESFGASVAGRPFSSLTATASVLMAKKGRLAKGLRIGMVGSPGGVV